MVERLGRLGLAGMLALAACSTAPAVSRAPTDCRAFRLRSGGPSPGRDASGVAVVPGGTWILRASEPRLALYGDARRAVVEVDVGSVLAAWGRPRTLQLVSNGERAGVLAQFDAGGSVFLAVSETGKLGAPISIALRGRLLGDPRGRFVVYDDAKVRFIERGRVVAPTDDVRGATPPPSARRSWAMASTPVGYALAIARVTDRGAARIVVRWRDRNGRPVGETVVLDTPAPEVLVYDTAIDPHVVAAGDDVAVLYGDVDALMFARVAIDGRIVVPSHPISGFESLLVHDVAAVEGSIYVAGSTMFRVASDVHDHRHRSRVELLQLDGFGAPVGHARLPTPTGSSFQPRIAGDAGGALVGIYQRERLGRRYSRRDHARTRWLTAPCH